MGKTLTITPPANITVTALAGATTAPVTYPPAKVTGGTKPYTVTYSQASGSQFPIGTTTVSIFARDRRGQTASSSFTITVLAGSTPPTPLVLTVPPTQTADSPDGNPVVVTYPPATATGGTAPLVITYSQDSGTSFPVGTTTVTVTVTDALDQVVTGSFSVIVNPPTPPPPTPLVLTVPPTQTAYSSTGAAVVVTYPPATATGGTAPITITYSKASGTAFNVGTTTVTVTATDSSSPHQTQTGSFLVVVIAPLRLTPPPTQTASSTDGNPVVVTYPAPTVTGGVPPYITSSVPASGSSFAVGTTTVNCSTTDSQGHTASGSFSVVVTQQPTPPPDPGPGTVYYVATTGSNGNPGTIQLPFLTLSYAVAQLVAGDWLYIRGGNYSGSANTIRNAVTTVRGGTSWSVPITIAGYPGETVTLFTPEGMGSIELTSSTQQYLVFQQFTVNGQNQTTDTASALIYQSNGSHHIRYSGLVVINSFVNGIQFSDAGANAPFNEVLGCTLANNGRNPANSNGGYGAYWYTSDNLFQGNEVFGNHGYGLHCISGSTFNCDRNIIERNLVHHNTINSTGTGNGGFTSYGIVVGTGDDIIVRNNVVYKNGVGGIVGSHGGGILVYNDAVRARILNNTVADNTGEGIAMQYYSTVPVLINNIVCTNGNGNIVNYDGAGNVIPYTAGTTNLTTAPAFIDPGANNYNLLATATTAINRGTTIADVTNDILGTTRPQGTASDIGAYEFVI